MPQHAWLSRPLPPVQLYFHDEVNLNDEDADDRNYTNMGNKVRVEFVGKDHVQVIQPRESSTYKTGNYTYKGQTFENCMVQVSDLVLEPTQQWLRQVERATGPVKPRRVTIEIRVRLSGRGKSAERIISDRVTLQVNPCFPSQLVLVDEQSDAADLAPVRLAIACCVH